MSRLPAIALLVACVAGIGLSAPARAADAGSGAPAGNPEDIGILQARDTFLDAQEAFRSGSDEALAILLPLARAHPCEALVCLFEFAARSEADDAPESALDSFRPGGAIPGGALCHPPLLTDPASRRRFLDVAAEAFARGASRDGANPAALGASETAGRILALESDSAALQGVRMSRALSAKAEAALAGKDRSSAAKGWESAARAARAAGDGSFALRASVLQARSLAPPDQPLPAPDASEGAAVLERALRPEADACRDVRWTVAGLTTLGEYQLELGMPLEALDRFREAIVLAPPADRPARVAAERGAGRACLAVGREAIERDRDEAAAETIAEGLDHSARTADAVTTARLQVEAATIEARAGRKPEAIARMRAALDRLRAAADDEGMSVAAERLAGLVTDSLPSESTLLYREAAEAASAWGEDDRVGALLAESAEVARRADLRREARRSIRIARSGEWGILSPDAEERLDLAEGKLLLREAKWKEAAGIFSRVRGRSPAAREAAWGRSAALYRSGEALEATEAIRAALPEGWTTPGSAQPPRPLLTTYIHLLESSGPSEEATRLRIDLLSRPDLLPALRAILDGTQGPLESLMASDDPSSALDAAAILAPARPAESRRQVTRARRLGIDPALPALDILTDP